ncbi:BaiN/RdsA family NAD(P)/FAD-dependent oxidoreductase [Ornithobacterium rhinotracheale]|uniref:NAD(P)/FAD-dependent oxidoreductase n=1 Tax=Ornithobacterium rhinotracheale TaxID=28251 RepID=UPI001FF59BB7|nr:NAD(P)/FAD-dependent oxidoreductase [Ornithobacterium rhinotracheale]MCK0204990.1 NAD(P)/FAD-dependent oxidoreductase [Ornithobacterium rhinotracheale]
MKKIAIIGGGAAGFFLGANLAPSFRVHIFEKAAAPMQKVRISGGGRCNLTHACFDPMALVDFYPRGNKELISVFGKFQPGDTMGWFEERGVPLKIQDDMRVFPASDNSMDIVETLVKENQKRDTQIHLSEGVKAIEPQPDGSFKITTSQGEYLFDQVAITTGSSPHMWQIIEKLGHTIQQPVPSLFTFKCNDTLLQGLQGTSFKDAELSVKGTSLESLGDLLITHWGLSGPAVLVLSAWGARILNQKNYKFQLMVNFIGESEEDCKSTLKAFKSENSKNAIGKIHPYEITKRFWHQLLEVCQIPADKKYAEIPDAKLFLLAQKLTQSEFEITGKSTFKDEFVTAGGVKLNEINFKTMESKIIPNLYFAGEVLDIDAVTGGFNFQACWSEAYLIAEAMNQ